MTRTKVAFIGVGDISGIYLENLTTVFKKEIEIVGLCDLIRSKAEEASKKYDIKHIYDTMEDVFADESVEIVLNLTRPNEHYGVTSAALKAGKSVYSEKPLASTLENGKKILNLAKEKKLLVGGAPDTFLGSGIQTVKKLIDSDMIGDIVSFNASMIGRGHESWHPGPAFYYQFGGGPMLDMGPYYISALVHLLGGVKSVTGRAHKTFPTRLITSEPLAGQEIEVEVATFVTGILEMDNGAIGNVITTFDCYETKQDPITIYGSKGTIKVPDPNTFDGPVYLLTKNSQEYYEVPLLYDYSENSRGLGLVEMANRLKTGKENQTDIKLTYHVLEVMDAFQRSSDLGERVQIESKY